MEERKEQPGKNATNTEKARRGREFRVCVTERITILPVQNTSFSFTSSRPLPSLGEGFFIEDRGEKAKRRKNYEGKKENAEESAVKPKHCALTILRMRNKISSISTYVTLTFIKIFFLFQPNHNKLHQVSQNFVLISQF